VSVKETLVVHVRLRNPQVPLGAIVGAAKFDVRSGVVSCGSLEATAAPGSSSSFEVFQGSPVVQIDGDHFQTPTFVFIDAVAGQGETGYRSGKCPPRVLADVVCCKQHRCSALHSAV
jgi:hypothetical protein